MEHLSDPKKTLLLANSLLHQSGVLILNLPMIDTMPAKILGKRWPFYLNVHLFYFTKQTASELLDQSGYELISSRRYWQTLSLGYVFARAGIKLPNFLGVILSLPIRYYMGQRTLIARKKE